MLPTQPREFLPSIVLLGESGYLVAYTTGSFRDHRERDGHYGLIEKLGKFRPSSVERAISGHQGVAVVPGCLNQPEIHNLPMASR